MRNRKKATAKKQNKTTKQHDVSFCLGSPSISFSQVNTMKSPGNRNQTENKNKKKKKTKLHPQRLRGTAFARKQNPDWFVDKRYRGLLFVGASLSLEEFDKHWTSGQAKGEITVKAGLTITRIDKWAAVRSITTSFSRINFKGGKQKGSRPRKTKQEWIENWIGRVSLRGWRMKNKNKCNATHRQFKATGQKGKVFLKRNEIKM